MKVKQIVGKQLFWPSRFGIGTRPEKVLPDSNSSWTDLDPGVTFTKIFKIILKFLSHRRPQSQGCQQVRLPCFRGLFMGPFKGFGTLISPCLKNYVIFSFFS